MPHDHLLSNRYGLNSGLSKLAVTCRFAILRAYFVIGVFASLIAARFAEAQTRFYVDSLRSTSGSGNADSPWKLISDIDWAAISNACSTNTVTLYFSSRGSWSPPSQVLTPQATGNAKYRFSIIGDEQYNTITSGIPVWTSESDNTHRALLTGGANFALPQSGIHHFTFKGFFFDAPLYSAVLMLSPGSACTNVYEVAVYNCACGSSVYGHGFAGDTMINGCSNVVVSGCQFSNTIGEGIYLGLYSDLTSNVRGVVVESNLLVNCGQPGHEGDIDIKPPCTGAIIRYNTNFHTSHTNNGSFCGVVIGADFCQAYGNTFHGAETNASGGWGCGIYLNADGDSSTGKAVTSCLIYNNLIYDCEQSGIKLSASSPTATANISGVKIWNNTVVGNWSYGCVMVTANNRTITVDSFVNNIIAGNTNSEVSVSSGVTLGLCDHNLYYRFSGSSLMIGDSSKTFVEWRALGYDTNGVNADPMFIDGKNFNFMLNTNSPARNLAVPSGFFTTDCFQRIRPPSLWDAGAIQSTSIIAPPKNLHIVLF